MLMGRHFAVLRAKGLLLFCLISTFGAPASAKPAEVDRMRRGFARVNVRALVGDEVAAEGVILAIFQPKR